MARIISLSVLTTLIVFLGIMFFRVIAPFLLPLFLAGVLAILCQPVQRYFTKKTNGRHRWAAALTTIFALTVLLVPVVVGTWVTSAQLVSLAQSDSWRPAVKTLHNELEINSAVEWLQSLVTVETKPDEEKTEAVETVEPVESQSVKPTDDLQAQIEENLQSALRGVAQQTLGIAGAAAGAAPRVAIGVLGSAASALISSLMFVIALYYFLADGPLLVSSTQALVPVQVDYQKQLIQQFESVVRAVVMATFLAAVVQGFLTAVLLVSFGFGHFFVFFMLAMLASLVPLAGTWLIWGPCAMWLASQGHWWSAGFMTVLGAGVIGMIDNVVRTYVLHSDAKLHPLLAFVSVLGGLKVMGLWGVFIGPIVASCLHALVKIFNTELTELSKEKFTQDKAPLLDSMNVVVVNDNVDAPPAPITVESTAPQRSIENANQPTAREKKASKTVPKKKRGRKMKTTKKTRRR